MENQKSRRFGLCFVIILILVIIYILYQMTYRLPYERFRARDEKAKPMFAALNNEVAIQLPIPPGVKEVERSHGGYHGDWLYITYSLEDASIEDILAHYQQVFLSWEWRKYPLLDEHIYFHDSSCVQVSVFPKEYHLYIWHDYYQQSFSPEMAPMWVISLHEFGEMSFPKCPDEWVKTTTPAP